MHVLVGESVYFEHYIFNMHNELHAMMSLALHLTKSFVTLASPTHKLSLNQTLMNLKAIMV